MDYYEQPTPYQGDLRQIEPHRGSLILTFGIVSLVGTMSCFLPVIFGILAWSFGVTDLRKMDSGLMDPSGRDMTNIGKILGIISVALSGLMILGIILYLVFIVGIIVAASTGGF